MSELDTKELETLDYRPSIEDMPIETTQSVTISSQHAYSLRELVKWFKGMISQGNMPHHPGRSDTLTTAYCDELLKDLEEGD